LVNTSLRLVETNLEGTLVLDRYGIVFGSYDLPLSVSSKPGIGADKAAFAAPFASPAFAPLNDRSISEKPYVGVVEMIGSKISGTVLRFGYGL
jgi:hypothetical protein